MTKKQNKIQLLVHIWVPVSLKSEKKCEGIYIAHMHLGTTGDEVAKRVKAVKPKVTSYNPMNGEGSSEVISTTEKSMVTGEVLVYP